jgi:hypothetical protein
MMNSSDPRDKGVRAAVRDLFKATRLEAQR